MTAPATEAVYGLSPLQEGMLAQSLRAPGTGIDVEQLVVSLPERVDAGTLQVAWDGVIARHSVLRTVFRTGDGTELLQEVLDRVEVPLRIERWIDRTPGQNDRDLQDFLKRDRLLGFDLASAPLMRVTLVELAPEDFRLVWTFHHIILDGRAFMAVLREVLEV